MFLYYEISGYGDNYDTENQNGHEHWQQHPEDALPE
jgi:hypothetical protein